MCQLLIISPKPTHPTVGGSRASFRRWVEAYRAAGIDFHIVFIRIDSGDEAAMARAWGADRCTFLPYRQPARPLLGRLWRRLLGTHRQPNHKPYHIDGWCGPELIQAIDTLARRLQPACVHLEYVYISRLLECFGPRVYKILNTHDIFAGRASLYLQHGVEPHWFFTTERQEAKGLNRADCIIAIQQQEAAYFQSLTKKPVFNIGTDVDCLSPRPPVTPAPVLAFIGSAYTPNEEALQSFCRDIWPRIRAELPDATLEIYGQVCEKADPTIPGIRLAGVVPDLAGAYNRAWLVICPLRFGTGLKRKCIEALGQGKALVTTAVGAEGLEDGRGQAFLCADDPAEFARLCLQVLRDPALRQQLEAAASAYVHAYNQKQQRRLQEVMARAGLLNPSAP